MPQHTLTRILLAVSLVLGAIGLHAHSGHDARSPMAWLGLGKHHEDHPDRYDGYLTVSQPMGLRFERPAPRFDRARLIPLNSIKWRKPEPEETEPVEMLPPPEPEDTMQEREIVITEPEVVEVEDMPEPIVQEDINSMYNEAGLLNPDDILLYLKEVQPNVETGGRVESGGAFRFELPQAPLPIRGEASLERTP